MKQNQRQEMKLGEQLIGLSPTVCRRAIAALRAADKALGEEKGDKPLPLYCEALLGMLIDKINIGSGNECRNTVDKDLLSDLLNQMEIFLDIVEGKISEKQLAAIANPLDDPREAAEETARRG